MPSLFRLSARTTLSMAAAILSLGLPTSAVSAASTPSGTPAAGFSKHFDLRRNSAGQVEWVMIKTKPLFATRRIANQVRTELKSLFKGGARLEENMDRVIATYQLNPIQAAQFRTAVRSLRQQDLDRLFATPQMKQLYTETDRMLAEGNIQVVNPFNVVANLRDSFYFYKASVVEAAIKKLISMAENLFLDNVPALSVAHFVMNRVEFWLNQRQDVYRMMAQFYLHTYGAEALGLTEQEGHWLLSSIYSSDLGWKDILDAYQIQAQWETFGAEAFGQTRMGCERRFDAYKTTWSKDFGGKGFAFRQVQIIPQANPHDRIVHLCQGHSKLNGEPATAWDFHHPERVRNDRVLLMAAEMGSHFVPYLIGPVKKELLKYLRSLYVPQITLEGALVGYFLSTNQDEASRQIADQSLNPFLMVELAEPPRARYDRKRF